MTGTTPPHSAGPSITPARNQAALDDLVQLLDLEVIEVNIFRGGSTDEERVRVFGGQVAGQALVAAARTIDEPGRLVHSLHAYFLRPGDPKQPILYEVDRIRDGRSFATRRVVAIQHGKAIFNLQASFHDDEPGGPDHQTQMDPGLTPPDELPDFHTRMAPYAERLGDYYHRPRPIDLRYVEGDPFSRNGASATGQHVWLRANGTLPDDPVPPHVCERHDVARHHAPTVRPFVGSSRSPVGQPRSCDVVPSAVPHRPMAAVPAAGGVDWCRARPRGWRVIHD